MTAPVKARMVVDVDSDRAPGAFEIVERDGFPTGMIYVCPCGCGHDGYLAFRPAPSPSWAWNGSTESPTLEPSVHHIIRRTGEDARTHWHGWLRNGEWISC